MSSDFQLLGFTFIQDGKREIIPPAIHHWKKTFIAIDALKQAYSDDFPNQVAITNMILILLVSGFETYCKVRFMELEKKRNFH